MNNDPDQSPRATAEKFATQAETGEGRTMARPGGGSGIGSGLQPGSTSPNNAPLGGDMGSIRAPARGTGASGRSGNATNDTTPEGGATGDHAMHDRLKPERRP